MKEFKLDNQPKISTGFNTPEHYFENFSKKFLDELPEKRPTVISIFQNRKVILLSLAALFVIALFVPLIINSTKEKNELDENTLENYISYQSNISQYDLINLLDKEDIESLKNEVNLEDTKINELQ